MSYAHPGTDMAQAMAETVRYVNRARIHAAGTVNRSSCDSTPAASVGYLVLSSETKTITQIQDQALNRVGNVRSHRGRQQPPLAEASEQLSCVRPTATPFHGCPPTKSCRRLSDGNDRPVRGFETRQMPLVPTERDGSEAGTGHHRGEAGRVPADMVLGDKVTAKLIEDASDIPTGYAASERQTRSLSLSPSGPTPARSTW